MPVFRRNFSSHLEAEYRVAQMTEANHRLVCPSCQQVGHDVRPRHVGLVRARQRGDPSFTIRDFWLTLVVALAVLGR